MLAAWRSRQTEGTSLTRWSLSPSQPRGRAHTRSSRKKKTTHKKKKTLREQRTSVPEWPREFAQRRSLCNARTRRLQWAVPEREPPLTSVSHSIRGSSPALQMSQVTPENQKQKQKQKKNGKRSLGPSEFFWLYFLKPVSCHLCNVCLSVC